MADKFHGRSLRKGRVSLKEHVYLVTAVTYQRQPVFTDVNAGRVVVDEIMRSARFGDTDTLAFVVMPDHLHWMFSLVSDRMLSSVVGAVKRYSARRINEMYSRGASQIWQRGFHDHALRRDEDVARVARYVVANPLRAGLVQRIGDYPLWDAVWL
jgi:putative transposase